MSGFDHAMYLLMSRRYRQTRRSAIERAAGDKILGVVDVGQLEDPW